MALNPRKSSFVGWVTTSLSSLRITPLPTGTSPVATSLAPVATELALADPSPLLPQPATTVAVAPPPSAPSTARRESSGLTIGGSSGNSAGGSVVTSTYSAAAGRVEVLRGCPSVLGPRRAPGGSALEPGHLRRGRPR